MRIPATRNWRFILTAAFVLAFACSARAQKSAVKSGDAYFVSTQWVADHLKDPSLVLLAVGERDAYDGGHIPGARYLDYSSISTPHDMRQLMLELPPVEQLVKVFEGVGVSDSSYVVVYFSNEWMTPTARAYLTLDYLGLRGRISYLDGGLPAWRKEGRPVTKDKPQFAAGKLTPHPRADVMAKMDEVKRDIRKPGVRIVDVRESECFSASGCGDERPGHIPSAVNIPWEDLVGDDMKLKSTDELRKIFQDRGVKAGDEVIAYCHIGQRASFVYLVSRMLGHEARLYDGSFEEWGQRENMPLEKSAATGK